MYYNTENYPDYYDYGYERNEEQELIAMINKNRQHMWIITADFDNEMTPCLGTAGDVLNMIDSWSNYAWDEISTSENTFHAKGFDKEVGVDIEYNAQRIDVTTEMATLMREYIMSLGRSEKEGLAYALDQDNSLAPSLIFHSINGGVTMMRPVSQKVVLTAAEEAL